MASRLQDVIMRGLASIKPNASTVAPGTLYFSTDTSITERSNGTIWESYAGGYWVDFAPSMTASAGTVTITLNRACKYTLIGKTMIVKFYLEIDLSGTPSYLILVIPASYIADDYSANIALDNLGESVLIQTLPNGTVMNLYRNTLGTGNWPVGAHTIGGTATFEVQ